MPSDSGLLLLVLLLGQATPSLSFAPLGMLPRPALRPPARACAQRLSTMSEKGGGGDVDRERKEALARLQKRIREEQFAKDQAEREKTERAARERKERDRLAREKEMMGAKADKGEELDMSMLKERIELFETKERQWSEILQQLSILEVQFGIKLLTDDGQPGPGAVVFILLSLAIPVYLAWELSQSLIAAAGF